MLMKFKMSLLAAVICCLTTAVLYAETIYSWTDKNGIRHMTNIPPAEASGKVEIMELKPLPPQTITPPPLQKEAVAKADETPIIIHRDHVIVPTSLTHKNVTIEAKLLLDTGATNITLHKEVAKKLSLKKPGKGWLKNS